MINIHFWLCTWQVFIECKVYFKKCVFIIVFIWLFYWFTSLYHTLISALQWSNSITFVVLESREDTFNDIMSSSHKTPEHSAMRSTSQDTGRLDLSSILNEKVSWWLNSANINSSNTTNSCKWSTVKGIHEFILL